MLVVCVMVGGFCFAVWVGLDLVGGYVGSA